MFNDFESPISVLGVWRPHVCPKNFVFNVLLNLSFYCHIWICPFSHLRRPLFCVMILYSICNKTHHVLARSGSAHFQATKQAYVMWSEFHIFEFGPSYLNVPRCFPSKSLMLMSPHNCDLHSCDLHYCNLHSCNCSLHNCNLHSCDLHSCNLHNCNLHNCCLRSCCGLHSCTLHICNLNVLPSASSAISNHQAKQFQSYIFTHTHTHTASSFLFIWFDSIRCPFRCRFWCSMTLNLRYRYWESEGLMFVPRILYSMSYSTYHFTAISGSAHFHISEDLYFVSWFCIQFVIKLIMSLPDLDQPIFKLPNKHT